MPYYGTRFEESVETLIAKVENLVGVQNWTTDWKKREPKAEEMQKMDYELFMAVMRGDWISAEKVWNDGATCDYINGYGWTAYYGAVWTGNREWAEKLIKEAKWETERTWATLMVHDQHSAAVKILKHGTLILPNPLFATLMLPTAACKEMMTDVVSTLHTAGDIYQQITTDLTFIHSNGHRENQNIAANIPLLLEIANSFDIDVQRAFAHVFENKFYNSEPLAWQYTVGRNKRFIAAHFKQFGIEQDITMTLQNDQIEVYISSSPCWSIAKRYKLIYLNSQKE